MIESKPWDWSKNESNKWLIPSIESCYLAESWTSKGFRHFLDLGTGLGRHAIYFAKKGFDVSAVDLSEYGLDNLRRWAVDEHVTVNVYLCDMLNLPFPDDSIDCIMSYNVIYHTDTEGFIRTLAEIRRVLRPGGEAFLTLISKKTESYLRANEAKRIDSNTILRDEHETEYDVPHFYVDIADIMRYLNNFEFLAEPVEQIEYNLDGSRHTSVHFNVMVRKK